MSPADPSRSPAAPGPAAPGTTSSAAEHRTRLLDAMAEAARERPFAEITVAEIVRRARTSRRTFYQHFTDREACLVALLQDRNTQTVASIDAAIDHAAPTADRIAQAITAWTEEVAADPGLTLAWIREVPGLGAAGRELTRNANDAFVALVSRTVDGVDEPDPERLPLVLVLVGGLRELVARAVEDGQDVRHLVDPAVRAALALLAPA